MIKQVRKALGLSQDAFAEKLGVSFSTVNRWENKKAKPNKLAQNSVFELAKSNHIDIAQMVYDRIDAEAKQIRLSENRMLLYHGSKSGITGTIAPISRAHCDFGRGFYMGTVPAQPLTLICDYDDAKFYIVSVDSTGLKQVDIKPGIEWALLIALKRGKLEGVANTALYKNIRALTDGFDMVSGCIADDRMFYVLDNFFMGNITDTALIGSLAALNLGKQIVAVTQKACDTIRVEKEIALSHLERLALQDAAEANRVVGHNLANEICKAHRREGKFFDEIIEEAK